MKFRSTTSFLFFLIAPLSFAQSLDWFKLYSDHSSVALAPITPSAAKDESGAVYVSVVENDTLKIYKYIDGGIQQGVLNTEIRLDKFTPIVNLSNDQFAIAFRENSLDEIMNLLIFDSSLNIIRLTELNLPEFDFEPDPLHLISVGDELFLTILDGQEHQLYKIDSENQTELIYNGNIEIGFGEEFMVLENGNLVFSFLNSNSHLVRCVSTSDGSVVWEHTSEKEDWQLRNYKIFLHDGEILKLTHDVVWVGSEAIGTIMVTRLNSSTGEEIGEVELFQEATCVYGIFDGVYNEANQHLYMAYYNSCDETYISLLEFDPFTAEPVHETSFEYFHDPLNIDQPAYLSVLANHKIAFIYKSFVDETEHGNLFVVRLNDDLSVDNTLEINLNPPNGSEAITHLLPIENSKFLLSGIIPDNDPFIFWEKVKYYTMMIDVDDVMSAEELENSNKKLLIYPNPSNQFVRVQIPVSGSGNLMIYDMAGKMIYRKSGYLQAFNSISLTQFPPGAYIIKVSIGKEIYQGRLLVN